MSERNKPARTPRPFGVKILINLCCMALAGIILAWGALLWLDVWTEHGDETVAPQVKGMTYAAASASLEAQGFAVELLDSVYDATMPPGTVTDQNPKAGAVVKSGREIYLTITAFNPKMVTLPKLTDVSERQARAMLAGLGITRIDAVSVPSDYKDLVVGVRVKNIPAVAGARIPVNERIVLEVGSGPAEEEPDTAAAAEAVESVAMDESFFD